VNFLSYFVDKTKLVNLMTALLLLIGIFAAARIQREAFPRVDFEIVLITTLYPGASPEDVEVNVTIPIEDELQGIDGIDEIESVSREGWSTIQVTIDPNASDPDRVRTDIQRSVDRVTDLPPDLPERPAIWELRTENFTVIEVALSSGRLDEKALRGYARRLKQELENLPRVARIETLGFRQREIQIQVDLAKLKAYELSLSGVARELQARNVRLPAGTLRTPKESMSVVITARYRDLEEVRNTILRSNFAGQSVRVRDIATVEDTFEVRTDMIKMNGNLGVTLDVIKKSGADILRTVAEVKRAVAAFQETAGNDVQADYITDPSRITRSILNVVLTNALLGIILVLAMLLLFLDFRTAGWTALGIPFALSITLFSMVLGGVSINNNSLIGLVIVLGLLVDDSIVVAESIYARRLAGMPALAAAREGLKAVASPVTATVATTMVAFAPFLFLPGILGKFIFSIPFVVILALAGSMIEAFLILPAHLTAHSLRLGAQPGEPVREKHWYRPILERYRRWVRVAVRHKILLISGFILLFFASVTFALTAMRFELFAQQTIDLGVFYLEGEPGASLERMEQITARLEQVVRDQPNGAVDSFTTQIGRGRFQAPANENKATLTLYFAPATERTKDAREVVEEVRKAAEAIPGIADFNVEEQLYGPPVGRDVEVTLIGNDNARRAALSREVLTFIEKLGGQDIESTEEPGRDAIAVDFDFPRLARYGLNAQDVALALRTALEGTVVDRTFTPEERIDYRVLLQERYREDPATIRGLEVANNQQQLVPIRSVVRMEEEPTVSEINHYNGFRQTTLTAALPPEGLTPVQMNNRLRSFLNRRLADYPGFSYEMGGEAQESAEAIQDVLIAFLVALVLIYFILVLQFDSFIQPAIIMVTIPFGAIGVIWTFALHGLPFSFLALVGFVGLSGIVVNDSIIMVSTINSLIRERQCKSLQDYRDAVEAGAASRLRPIVLTTVTTVAGVLPTAYGFGGYVEQIAPMVLGLGWGLVFASGMTLFLIPGLYLAETRLEMALSRRFPWLPIRTRCGGVPGEVDRRAR